MKVTKKVVNQFEFIECEVSDRLVVILCSFGASVYSIKFDGELMNITPKDVDDFYLSDKYYGKTLGPTSGRIKNAELCLDGKIYHLDANERGHCLHGGNHSLSFTNFESQVDVNDDEAKIVFKTRRHDKDGGYPGTVDFQVQYLFKSDEDEFSVRFLAETLDKSIVNMTNHLYFNLGERDIGNLYLKIKSARYYKMDDDLLPLEPKLVTKPLNFRMKKQIKKDISNPALKGPHLNGYDHIFLIDLPSLVISSLTLEGPRYKLKIYSNFDAAIIYSDNYPSLVPLLNGYENTLHSGVTAEFCAAKPQIITNFKPFDYTIRYRFYKRRNGALWKKAKQH